MINFLSKNRWGLIILLGIAVLFFALRLPNLTLQPIFADEAIYIRWAQIMRAEPTLRFISLSDGKTPLFMWVLMPLLKVFSDPLYAGRLLSVISGLMTLLGAFFLGWRFINLRTGIIAAFLVAITPFMVFFDRLSLVDTMLAAFSIWSLNFALLLAQKTRLDLAMILGYLLGGAMLTKTPGVFNLLTLPVTILVVKFSKKNHLIKVLMFWVVASLITLAIYNILRLGPGFSSLSARNQDYVFSPWELLSRPLDPFIPHVKDSFDWFTHLLSWPIMVLVLVGVTVSIISRNRFILVVFLWSLIPLLIQMALLKTYTARYILSSIPPLLVIGGFGVDYIIKKNKLNKILTAFLMIVISILPMRFNLQLLQDPAKADLPKNERRGYLEDWTAGYGLKEIASYLINEAKKQQVVVATEGYFGTLPDGLSIYLDTYNHQSIDERKVIVVGSEATISAQLMETARSRPTYFVANKTRYYQWQDGELIKEYPKAKGSLLEFQDSMLLFRVKPASKK